MSIARVVNTSDYTEVAAVLSIEQALAKMQLALDTAQRRHRTWNGTFNSVLNYNAQTTAELARAHPAHAHAKIAAMTALLVRYAEATDAQLDACRMAGTIDVTRTAYVEPAPWGVPDAGPSAETGARVIGELRRRGFSVRIDGRAVVVTPGALLTAAERDEIARQKPGIVAALSTPATF